MRVKIVISSELCVAGRWGFTPTCEITHQWTRSTTSSVFCKYLSVSKKRKSSWSIFTRRICVFTTISINYKTRLHGSRRAIRSAPAIEDLVPRHRRPSIRRGAATDSHFPGAGGAPRKWLPLPHRMGTDRGSVHQKPLFGARAYQKHTSEHQTGPIRARVGGPARASYSVQDQKPGFRASPDFCRTGQDPIGRFWS